MRNQYQQLQAEERAMIRLMQNQSSSIREIGRTLTLILANSRLKISTKITSPLGL
jgi:IS30 family transposase